MFNTSLSIGGIKQTVNFNTPCTGLIQKSTDKSKFARFQKGAGYEKSFFHKDNPYIYNLGYNGEERDIKNIIILQIMLFGDNNFLVEYIEIEN